MCDATEITNMEITDNTDHLLENVAGAARLVIEAVEQVQHWLANSDLNAVDDPNSEQEDREGTLDHYLREAEDTIDDLSCQLRAVVLPELKGQEAKEAVEKE